MHCKIGFYPFKKELTVLAATAANNNNPIRKKIHPLKISGQLLEPGYFADMETEVLADNLLLFIDKTKNLDFG